MSKFSKLILIQALCISFLSAQTRPNRNAEPPIRDLRMIVVGSRPLPEFETRDNQTVEVDPPLSKLPPTSFEFAKPSHAPRDKTSFSARPNTLVRIPGYKGPPQLALNLKRALIQPNNKQQVNCELGEVINPLILIQATPGSAGWEQPTATVIDFSATSTPARSMVVANASGVAITVYLTQDGVVVPPNSHVILPIPASDGDTVLYSVRYRADASDGKELPLANSSYRLNDNSRLIMLALPGHKTKAALIPCPKLRIISDSM